jgi:hypothetical protein
MKTVYIAGFFSPVLDQIRGAEPALYEEKSLVWVPQRPDRMLDLVQIKAGLFDQAARGVEAILICAFAFRGHEHTLQSLDQIKGAVVARHPETSIEVLRFKNGQDSEGVLSAIRSFGPNRIRRFPASLDQLEGWAATTCATRLILHPRAIRAAKTSEYRDAGLIYASLSLLCEEYWQMRTAVAGSESNRTGAFTNKLGLLGLELAPSISETRAGEEGDEYRVIYPLGGTAKRLLDLHLKKGSDRDSRNCLRIYFFWDAVPKIVVVGWLPSHLSTRAS